MPFNESYIEINDTLHLKVDKAYSILWIRIGTPNELHYSYKTVCTISDTIPYIKKLVQENNIRYTVLLSANKNVWNMGGDLELFADCVKNRNIDTLRDYALKCINVVYNFNAQLDANVIVVSIVQGNAFGGGFECALAGNYIIAEEHAKFSFPEVVFGTFPGMGAYSFLTRKIGYNRASEMINSNEKWTSQELKKSGIIDFVTECGNGINCFYELLNRNQFTVNSKYKSICASVPISELHNIIELWIESVMALNEKKIRIIEKIISAQRQFANEHVVSIS
jgi:DSF synthase